MAVTPNYGWPVPVATDYVKDGWEAISDLGNAIDTTVAGLGSGINLINTTTLSAAANTTISNVFTSTYDNYKIILSGTCASGNTANVSFQFTASGTPAAGSDYFSSRLVWSGGNAATRSYAANATTCAWAALGGLATMATLELARPHDAVQTTGEMFGSGWGSPDNYTYFASFYHNLATSYDGIKITFDSNFTGKVRVYGYED